MEVAQILRCLIDIDTELEAGETSSSDGGFVLVEAEWDGAAAGSWSASARPVSCREALDQLAAKLCERGHRPKGDPDDPALAGIRPPHHRALAEALLGLQEEIHVLPEPPSGNPYLDTAIRASGGSHPVVAVRDGAAEGLDFTLAVMELTPDDAPAADPVLLAAAARGDVTAIEGALAAGARVRAADADGMTALHHAAAHRQLEAVDALVRAGADPLAGAANGASVCFAGLDEQGRVRVNADHIEGNAHGGIIVALVAAGADVNARDAHGRTLVDLAIATTPYPEQVLEYLHSQGGRPAKRATEPLPELLRDLAPGDFAAQAIRVNEVQYRLEHATDPVPDALHWLLGPEWTEDEVGAETLFELTHLLLDNGAADTVMAGWRPLDRAYDLYANGRRPQYRVVTYRLCKAGFDRSLRGLLKWIPDTGPAMQREHLAAIDRALSASTPNPDTLHWLLAPHGWRPEEVDGEILGELVDLLLAHGAANSRVEGRTPWDWATSWRDMAEHPQYQVIVDRLRAAGFGED